MNGVRSLVWNPVMAILVALLGGIAGPVAALTPSDPQGGAWGGWSASAESADGQYMASVSLRGDVALWKPETGENLFLERFPGVIFRSVTLNDTTVVAAGEDGSLKAFNDRGRVLNFSPLPGTVRALAAGPNGFWSVCDDGNLRFESWQGSVVWTVALQRQAPVLALALSKDGQWLALAGEDGKLEVRSAQDGHLFATWQVTHDWVRTVTAIPGGWLCGDDQGNLTTWGPWGEAKKTIPLGEPITALVVHQTRWAAGSLHGTLWDGNLGQAPSASWPCSVGPVAGIFFQNNGWLTLGADGGLRLWSGFLGEIHGEILP
ncbi:MAG: WD40 repeat domain-containing protein [Spirochaetales bacterium]|nr:WD40 repeat domain-containing protein [Spirochaetales bacterium]